MFKSLTVNRVSIYVSLVISSINVLFYYGYYLSSGGDFSWEYGVIIFLAFALVTFLFFRYFLASLIFPRIKLIYEIINDSLDSSPKSKKLNTINSASNLNRVNRKVMEWAIERRSEMESIKKLENYRRQYLGNISHELKTPLFSIQGYLHTLLDGGLEDQQVNKKYLEKALANAERLQLIVDDLEVINKLEYGAPLEISEFSIKRLIEDVIDDLELVAKEQTIKITIADAPEQGLWVEADKSKIRQVIENLLTNSIKYGIENGRTKIYIKSTLEKVHISIEDNGIGIAKKHLNHLFDRFYRVDKSGSRKLGGSGLGLSIVKHIIEAHDERIELKSEEGKGSTFSFSLPKMKYSVDEA